MIRVKNDHIEAYRKKDFAKIPKQILDILKAQEEKPKAEKKEEAKPEVK
jgi:hypothetical protein